jgi:uncharacterized coiled-coil DUF342 family protein
MEANCQKHTAEIEALKDNNSRIMERLDRLEEKMDETNNMIREFIASAPAKFASRDEFESQKIEIERVRGAFRLFYWMISGGALAFVAFLKFVFKVF